VGDKGYGGIIPRTLIASAVGGTSSLVAGGKFANGAVTGAFVHLFNTEAGKVKKWVYTVKTGVLTSPEGKEYYGYSGAKGIYQNNPDYENVEDFGPTPRGEWTIGGFDNSKGPLTIDLSQSAGTETYGRDLFRIHGGNGMGTASEGCIIINGVGNRREIVDSAYKTLLVR